MGQGKTKRPAPTLEKGIVTIPPPCSEPSGPHESEGMEISTRDRVETRNGKRIQTLHGPVHWLDSYSVRNCRTISPDRAGSATATRRCLYPVFRLRTSAPGDRGISDTLPTSGELF